MDIEEGQVCMLSFTESVTTLLQTRTRQGTTQSAAICVSANKRRHTGVLTSASTPPSFPPEAPFLIYSITKSFLAATALKLVTQQALELDRPIARWLPTVPHSDRITLRQLLRHVSGLPDYGGIALYHEAVKRGDQPWSDAEFLAHTQSNTLLYPPGQGWQYSNIGYMIIRQLLEIVQKVSLHDILHAEIFAPLGLTNTFVVTSDAQLTQCTFGLSSYLGSPEHPIGVPERYHVDWIAHRVIASTVAEIAQFYEALLDEHLVPASLLREMCTFTPLPSMPDRPFLRPGYGMGLQIDQGWVPGPVYGHSGSGPGVQLHACSLRRRSDPITIVVATTGEDLVLTEEIALNMLEQYAG